MSLPVITTQPQSVTANALDNVAFILAATSDAGALSYQWYCNGQTMADSPSNLGVGPSDSGTQTNTLRLYQVTYASVAGYFCRVRNGAGSVDSQTVYLVIGDPTPTITSQPVPVVTTIGAAATFSVTATAPNGGLSYQWYFRADLVASAAAGTPISGATASTLTIPSVAQSDLGVYYCFVESQGYYSSAASAVVSLTVPGVAVGTGSGGSSGGLASPIYSGAASAFAAFFGESWDPAGVYPDGDWTIAQPHGMGWPEFPFAGEGDQSTVLVKRRWMQSAYDFVPAALGTACPYNATLLLLDEDDFKDEGGGIVSWTRTYATLPAARDVFESYAYGFQRFSPSGTNVALTELTFEVSSRVRCEYFHVRDRAQWPPLLAPRVIQLSDNTFIKRGKGDLRQATGAPLLIVSGDAEILAEDSKEKMWRYPFMERRSRYIAGPTLAFWGSSFNVTLPNSTS